jgi:hypothetical protein
MTCNLRVRKVQYRFSGSGAIGYDAIALNAITSKVCGFESHLPDQPALVA